MEQTRLIRKRSGSIDLTKALAICAVLLIHCSANRFAMFDVGSNRWLATTLWGTVSRWAVPVFLMCSGALMNDPTRDLSMKKLFSKYILRLVMALSVWAAAYECLRIYISRDALPISELLINAVKNWCCGSTYYHLYYFYFAMALYLALPLTRMIAKHSSASELRYILILWFTVGSVVPCIKHFYPFTLMQSSLWMFSLSPLFLCPALGLLGWYLLQHAAKKWYSGPLIFFLGFAVSFFGTWYRSHAAGTLDAFFLDAFNIAVLCMAVGLFRTTQWLADRYSIPSVITFISRASFCIYLTHPYFQWLIMPTELTAMAPYWGVPLQAAIIMAPSIIAYLILRKIPFVKQWLI